jgi:hypothetical protein
MSEVCHTYRGYGADYITICKEEIVVNPEKEVKSSENKQISSTSLLADIPLEELLKLPVRICEPVEDFFTHCEAIDNKCWCWSYQPLKTFWK